MLIFSIAFKAGAAPAIFVNQVAYDSNNIKLAVVKLDLPNQTASFSLLNARQQSVYSGKLSKATQVKDWDAKSWFCKADFSAFQTSGTYHLQIKVGSKVYRSANFNIGPNALIKTTLPALLNYFRKQRANTPQELSADQNMLLYGSDQRVDIRGGWADASGDISKYFSHLAYTNLMSPQQIPLVTWSLIQADEAMPKLLDELHLKDSLQDEALWGADYLIRSLSKADYFYMTVFSYFKPDASARRIVGLEANSVTTSDYQSAFREGAGVAIAALARISKWNKHGAYTSGTYLAAAERAFAHLLINNLRYDDDHKENIIDDYCALLAATELWKATGKELYRTEARKRSNNLCLRITPAGYFMANDQGRPFWHASDAGLPVVSLIRYLKVETDQEFRARVIKVIDQSANYNLRVTNHTTNPFGYARQTFNYKNTIKEGFFIPHENESGWWWQGENARLGSLATAALLSSKLHSSSASPGRAKALNDYANTQLSWILGTNPYNMCFMYGMGGKQVPYMAALFGHGSQRGGISNGITGKEGRGDGSGIDFKIEDKGNEWRWTEQWLPHAAWFLQALTAMAEEKPEGLVLLSKPRFKALALAENGGHHIEYSKRAKVWLNSLATDSNFVIDYVTNTDGIDSNTLKNYQLIIQLDYAPYAWKPAASKAFEQYIDRGTGGWIGFHHATLLGEFDGFPMWTWFSDFMGDIRFLNYIPDFASATVKLENGNHPVLLGVKPEFLVAKEEWYTYNKSPRLHVKVLASVLESTYHPDSKIKMGDHPVIWSNPGKKAKNVYIFMGHDPGLFDNANYVRLFRNSIFWAAQK
ncbi:cellulase-like Ig domain-containing protein [Pedobacter duraquae]|uniref:Cellulase-like Ig domain-containing protein n=2 Tax=Pedobacter duraquae TaxID=425511 RepID=A0A4R6IPS3_9SPHI|nr:cellulase-like Ig domain-containing protein [Pedobacter duraquae]